MSPLALGNEKKGGVVFNPETMTDTPKKDKLRLDLAVKRPNL